MSNVWFTGYVPPAERKKRRSGSHDGSNAGNPFSYSTQKKTETKTTTTPTRTAPTRDSQTSSIRTTTPTRTVEPSRYGTGLPSFVGSGARGGVPQSRRPREASVTFRTPLLDKDMKRAGWDMLTLPATEQDSAMVGGHEVSAGNLRYSAPIRVLPPATLGATPTTVPLGGRRSSRVSPGAGGPSLYRNPDVGPSVTPTSDPGSYQYKSPVSVFSPGSDSNPGNPFNYRPVRSENLGATPGPGGPGLYQNPETIVSPEQQRFWGGLPSFVGSGAMGGYPQRGVDRTDDEADEVLVGGDVLVEDPETGVVTHINPDLPPNHPGIVQVDPGTGLPLNPVSPGNDPDDPANTRYPPGGDTTPIDPDQVDPATDLPLDPGTVTGPVLPPNLPDTGGGGGGLEVYTPTHPAPDPDTPAAGTMGDQPDGTVGPMLANFNYEDLMNKYLEYINSRGFHGRRGINRAYENRGLFRSSARDEALTNFNTLLNRQRELGRAQIQQGGRPTSSFGAGGQLPPTMTGGY